MDRSLLQKLRLKYLPPVPPILRDLSVAMMVPMSVDKRLKPQVLKLFPKTQGLAPFELVRGEALKSGPLRVGVIFSGGQAAGGHNVIAGLFDALKEIHPESELIGFLGGPLGILENRRKILGAKEIEPYRNQGGFELIGSGRDKIELPESFERALENTRDLDGLVVIGGDDSNTNAALLAEYFLEKGSKTRVTGVPKTIDGDLRSKEIEISFGFDSACKTYSELIGNIGKDVLSSKKYYHFIKLMGRSASHITLECALQTRPNLALIGEEGWTMDQIVGKIKDLVIRRRQAGKDYGMILVPEGLIEFIPEIKTLIDELNQILAKGESLSSLSKESRRVFEELPEKVQKQLTLERDPHGNVQVSLIETDLILIEKVKKELSFNAVGHFFGYEGRACFPTNFDAKYGRSLGILSALSIRDGLTGTVASIQNLHQPVEKWQLKAVPIVDLIHFEVRKGREKPVIRKALVDINQGPFIKFLNSRKSWELEDLYSSPGPIQFFGDPELTDSVPITLKS